MNAYERLKAYKKQKTANQQEGQEAYKPFSSMSLEELLGENYKKQDDKKEPEPQYIQPTIHVKHLFSLMNVETLRELAIKHNVQTQIKHPSLMRKAELINSLSEHYNKLMGHSLFPIPNKELNIEWSKIPAQWKPMKPKKESNIKVKKPEYELAMERRAEKASKYTTDKALKKAIMAREKSQKKAKEQRIAKKNKTKEDKQKLLIEKQEKQQPINENDIPENKFINELNNLLARTVFCTNQEPNYRWKTEFNNIIQTFNSDKIRYERIKNLMIVRDKTKADSIINKISTLLNDNKEKFNH